MPADWYSPALVFFGAAAWPIALLMVLCLFRAPIRKFIDEVTQLEWRGTKATRSGNLLSRSLRQDTLEDLGVEDSDVPAADTEVDEGADREHTRVTDPDLAQLSAQPDVGRPQNDEEIKLSLLEFVGTQIYQKLLNTKRQRDTRSSAVSAELVRTAYSDLRLGVRYLGQNRLGSDKIAGVNWPLASSDTILRRLGAPQEQIDLTRQIRRLEEQVESREVRVDGSGAGDFVQTAINIHIAIYAWAGVDVQASRRH